jgi:hypothetical protein
VKYPKNIEEIKKFAEDNNIVVKYLLGERYEDNLDLCSVKSLSANIKFNVGGKIFFPTKHKVKVIWN